MRMHGTMLIGLAVYAFAGGVAALAQPTLIIQDLITEPQVVSSRYVGLDVKLDSLDGSDWITGGLYAKTANGAECVYAADPNGVVRLTKPDPDEGAVNDMDRFVTFVSKPRVRNGDNRFQMHGEPDVTGKFWCDGVGPTIDPTEVDVGYTPDTTEVNPRYVARVVIDLSNADLDPATAVIDAVAVDDVYVVSGAPLPVDQCVSGTILPPTNPGDVLLAYGVAGAGTTVRL